MRTTVLLAALALASPLALQAEAPHQPTAGDTASGVSALSEPLREALRAEMQAVQAGMVSVLPALVAGHWDEVAAIGERIRDSYIMRQALTPSQLEELHEALPPDFQALDARFHEDAAMLIHVAEAKKPELVGFYVGRMMEACVTCHSRHATEKFPALADHADAGQHAH